MKSVKNVTKLIIMFIVAIAVLIAPTNVTAANENIIVKSMSPEYDENSDVELTNKKGVASIWFNDKNQSVKYNVVIQNKENYDVKISDIKLSTPTEEFLKFTVEGIKKDDVIKSNETKELVISFETVEGEDWGRNFSDSLITNITFDKVEKKEEIVEKPIETPKDEVKEEVKEETKEEVKEELQEEEKQEVENPFTSNQGYIITLIAVVGGAGIYLYVVRKKKVTKYIVPVLMIATTLTFVNAEESIELPIRIDVNFKSQNVMKKAYTLDGNNNQVYRDHWVYRDKIKNIYIKNQTTEIKDYAYKFDVSNDKNGRVISYLVKNKDNSSLFDLYLIADGVIYFNSDSSSYFRDMQYLNKIDNIEGVDTGNITDMSYMFSSAGYNTDDFKLDLSSWDTSKVTTMESMFAELAFKSKKVTLDVSDFDTSEVTNMKNMFSLAAYNSESVELDLSKWDTSSVTNMSGMFPGVGYNSQKVNLNLSNWNTSKVTTMQTMFNNTAYNSEEAIININNWDTSNVTDMRSMFNCTAYNSPTFNINVSHLNTSKVIDAAWMFYRAGYNSNMFNTSITIRNKNMSSYDGIFKYVSRLSGSNFQVNYTADTSNLVTGLINNHAKNANIVKGTLVE